jgi:hypothetical protein
MAKPSQRAHRGGRSQGPTAGAVRAGTRGARHARHVLDGCEWALAVTALALDGQDLLDWGPLAISIVALLTSIGAVALPYWRGPTSGSRPTPNARTAASKETASRHPLACQKRKGQALGLTRASRARRLPRGKDHAARDSTRQPVSWLAECLVSGQRLVRRRVLLGCGTASRPWPIRAR